MLHGDPWRNTLIIGSDLALHSNATNQAEQQVRGATRREQVKAPQW